MREQPTPEPQNVTRRKFIKRSGGATVGTAIGLYALGEPSWAVETDDSSRFHDINSRDVIFNGNNPAVSIPVDFSNTVFDGHGVELDLILEADWTPAALLPHPTAAEAEFYGRLEGKWVKNGSTPGPPNLVEISDYTIYTAKRTFKGVCNTANGDLTPSLTPSGSLGLTVIDEDFDYETVEWDTTQDQWFFWLQLSMKSLWMNPDPPNTANPTITLGGTLEVSLRRRLKDLSEPEEMYPQWDQDNPYYDFTIKIHSHRHTP